jgi:hypothetical protein
MHASRPHDDALRPRGPTLPVLRQFTEPRFAALHSARFVRQDFSAGASCGLASGSRR